MCIFFPDVIGLPQNSYHAVHRRIINMEDGTNGRNILYTEYSKYMQTISRTTSKSYIREFLGYSRQTCPNNTNNLILNTRILLASFSFHYALQCAYFWMLFTKTLHILQTSNLGFFRLLSLLSSSKRTRQKGKIYLSSFRPQFFRVRLKFC